MIRTNGKVIRNIPEQVGKNKYDINALVNLLIDLDTKVNNLASGVYKPQGDATVAELNALTVNSSMNGYVYNVTDSGTLTQGSINVIAGDNVVIVWKEDLHTFEWDLLSGIVDLSNYVTLTTDQIIGGYKKFSDPAGITAVKYSGEDYGSLDLHGDEGVYITTGSSYRFVDVQGDLDPSADNTYDLGSSHTWKDLYLSNALNLGTSGILKYDSGLSAFTTNSHVMPAVTANYDLGSSSNAWKDLYLAGVIKTNDINTFTSTDMYIGNSSGVVNVRSTLRPYTNNSRDLGSNSLKWKDFYVAGNISNGTDTVTVEDLAALITYAKAQGWIS